MSHFEPKNAPGPTPLELLRAVPAIRANPPVYLLRCARQYGDVVRFQAGKVSAVFINHPDVRERMVAELQREPGDRAVTVNDLPRLELTARIFNEALRLYPPAWLITRKAIEADVVMGCAVPAGALVILSPYTLHRHPAFWPNPETFDPERFLPEAEAQQLRYAYIPFGGGPRQCIGNNFALVEGQLILATVARRFRLELPPGRRVVVEPLVTLRPRHGLPMIIRKI
jgi:cytochrome P450